MPIEISNATELKQSIEADMAGSFVLVGDIVLGSFEPIGYDAGGNHTWFTGTFDGQDYKIHDGTISYAADDYIGLFCRTDGATIKNLIFKNVDVNGEDYVGGIVGFGRDSTIKNIFLKDVTIGTARWEVGGVIGDTFRVVIEGVIAENVDVAGHTNIGGIAGQAWDASISQCCFSGGTVTGNGDSAGGITGKVNGSNNDFDFIEKCVVKNSTISGGASGYYVGGVIGDVTSSSHTELSISECCFVGTVNTNTDRNGGLVAYRGDNSVLNNCYARGLIYGNDYIGGIVGYDAGHAYGDGEIWNCYSNMDWHEQDWGAGILGQSIPEELEKGNLTCYYDEGPPDDILWEGYEWYGIRTDTSNMKNQGTYSGWDFNNIWAIDPERNDGYPYLQCEDSVCTFPIDINIWVFKSGSFKSIDLATKISSLFKDNAGVWVKKGGTFRSV